jgi:hypothetical protein
MLSYQAIWLWQNGQKEREGLVTSSPSLGKRYMTTFKKLPTTRPKAVTIAETISSETPVNSIDFLKL